MPNTKKTKKKKKKSEKPENNVLSEGDVKTEKSCDTCFFKTVSLLNENAWCKRNREFVKTLKRKNIITAPQPFCKLWHVSLR